LPAQMQLNHFSRSLCLISVVLEVALAVFAAIERVGVEAVVEIRS
jgi:hypothetical protein